MTDKKRLEKIGEGITHQFQKNILEHLEWAINRETEQLSRKLYIPEKERDIEFLKDVLKALGYLARFEEDQYNPFWECACYWIYLCR